MSSTARPGRYLSAFLNRLFDAIESIPKIRVLERCGCNPVEQHHLSKQQLGRAGTELRDSPEYHQLQSAEAVRRAMEWVAKDDDPPRLIPTREDQHELESYLIKIGRAEHEFISHDLAFALREYGELGVRALRLQGWTEAEIWTLRNPEIPRRDWIYSSQTIYGKARGYKGKHPYFKQDRENGTIAHFEHNNGKPRYVISDHLLHGQVVTEVKKLNAAKWQRARGEAK
jgi:hypothetical protein